MMQILHEQKFRELRYIYAMNKDKPLHSKIIRLKQHSILALEYKRLFEKALQIINYRRQGSHRNYLRTLWNFMGLNPVQPFAEYSITPKNISYAKQFKYESLWQKYIVTESGEGSLFSSMERLKLVNSTISKAVNLNFLVQRGFVKAAFPLNDPYELQGRTRRQLYTQLQKDLQRQSL